MPDDMPSEESAPSAPPVATVLLAVDALIGIALAWRKWEHRLAAEEGFGPWRLEGSQLWLVMQSTALLFAVVLWLAGNLRGEPWRVPRALLALLALAPAILVWRVMTA